VQEGLIRTVPWRRPAPVTNRWPCGDAALADRWAAGRTGHRASAPRAWPAGR